MRSLLLCCALLGCLLAARGGLPKRPPTLFDLRTRSDAQEWTAQFSALLAQHKVRRFCVAQSVGGAAAAPVAPAAGA